MTNVKRTITLVFLLLAGLVAACNKAPPPPLLAGAAPWAGYEPLSMAQQLGYLSDRVRLNEYATPEQAAEAMKKGSVQLATMTLGEALLLRRDMPDLKVILLLGMRKADQSVEVMVVRDDSIGQFHRELLALLAGWLKVQDVMRADPAKAYAVMAQSAHVEAAEIEAQSKTFERYDMERNRALMMGELPLIATRIDAVQHDMISRGELQVGEEASLLVDNTLLTELSEKGPAAESGVAGRE